MKFIAVCLSAAIQRTAIFENLHINEVNRSIRYRLDASGKGVNAARVLNQLEEGCVSVICPAGKENTAEFVSLAKKDNLRMILIPAPGKIRECCTLVEIKTGCATELVMDEADFTDKKSRGLIAAAEKKLIDAIQKELPQTDALLFAGSSPKMWAQDLKQRICEAASRAGLVLLVDFWGKELLSVLEVCRPDIIKINVKEFYGTFSKDRTEKEFSVSLQKTNAGQIEKKNQRGQDEKQLTQALCSKSRELQNCIIVTRGKDSTIAAFKGQLFNCPAETVKAINPIGCGDSFSAGFLYEYLKTAEDQGQPDIEGALKRGTWCAARNAECEKVGTLHD